MNSKIIKKILQVNKLHWQASYLQLITQIIVQKNFQYH